MTESRIMELAEFWEQPPFYGGTPPPIRGVIWEKFEAGRPPGSAIKLGPAY